MSDFIKISAEGLAEITHRAAREPQWAEPRMKTLQTAVYVMCGGGFLGRMAAEQPFDFYIDDRVSRLPYSKRAILQAVSVLAALATGLGIARSADMPRMMDMHNAGIF